MTLALNRALVRDRFASMKEHNQLDLFADRAPTQGSSNAPPTQRLAPRSLSDAALIEALPHAVLGDACALAAEAGRRRLNGAVTALVALCNRFVGFGVDREAPEQAAALRALAAIGGPDASRSVGRMIAKGVVQGPTLAVAAAAASQLGVIFPPDVALTLLRHWNPSVRASACDCVRVRPDIVAMLTELLLDRDREVSTAAACGLGRMGRVEARNHLKRCLNERPSPRVIEALAAVADEEAVVFLARIGRARPELAASILSALDGIDHPRAPAAASGLRDWLSRSR
jgi:HEAT repeats